MATPTTIHVQLFLSGSPGPSTKITLPAPTAATSSDGLTVDALRTLLTTTSENFATHFNDVPASHLRVFANREDAAKASESLKDVREQELAQKGPDDVDENAVVEMEPQGPLEKIIAEGNGKIYCCFMREVRVGY
ncbi:hypothetical protein HK104_011082 [Borealophlyctis nickersoniae]|nr:hypothetical protein HK104_011082 [Borealophlyctis nickersoniae]